MKIRLSHFILVVLAVTCVAAQDNDKTKRSKMTADEVVAKHIASIGTPEALAKINSRVLVGEGRLTGKVGVAGFIGGPVQIASEGDKFLLAMVFNSNEYPYEKVGFDGRDLTVGRPSGRQTELGKFLRSQTTVLKEGLMGGVLSSAWPLLNLAQKKARVEYDGITSAGGREFHKLKYSASRSGTLKVTLFFDSENFRHVLTEYKYSIESGIRGDLAENARAKPSYFSLVERFGDFRKAGELTLPFSYSIDISNQVEEELTSLQWTVKLTEAYYNEAVDASVFKVS